MRVVSKRSFESFNAKNGSTMSWSGSLRTRKRAVRFQVFFSLFSISFFNSPVLPDFFVVDIFPGVFQVQANLSF